LVLGAVSAVSAFVCAMAVFGLINELRTGFLADDVWLDFSMILIFAAFSLWFAYFMGRRYTFESGSVLCVWANGRELWREDLQGLLDIVCTSGRGGITWMKLQWPKRSRRVQLFDGLRRALDSEVTNAAKEKARPVTDIH
jgi:hypothetical protein